MFEAHRESLDSRPCPAWFDEAKFGIFIHWALYSVPAWAPKGAYSEWYWNSMQNKDGATWKFHEKTYGSNFRCQDFVPHFRTELFDPDAWADLFVKAGAKYVALTSKRHDGFCLWQAPQSWNWNSVDVGPHCDLLGERTTAGRAKGLKMGLYFSLYEWYHPLYRLDPRRFAAVYAISFGWPGKEWTLNVPKPSGNPSVTLLGRAGTLRSEWRGGVLAIEIPPLSVADVPCRHAYAFKLTGIA